MPKGFVEEAVVGGGVAVDDLARAEPVFGIVARPGLSGVLDAIPDMRDALNEADESELIELFDAFDVSATYTKSTRRLELAASVTPELVASHGRSQEDVQNPPPLFQESRLPSGFPRFFGTCRKRPKRLWGKPWGKVSSK